MRIIHNALLVLAVILTLSACEKENDAYTEPRSKTEVIRFSPESASWFVRESPDSLIVEISGGSPPYTIKERPSFSSQAIIRNNQLIIFPKNALYWVFNDHNLGFDFVSIKDNYGNVNSFNIYQSYQEYYYTDSIFSITTTDTSLDLSILNLIQAQYDPHIGRLNVNYNSTNFSNSGLSLSIDNIKEEGIHNLPKYGFSFNYNGDTYWQTDTNQTVNVTKLTINEIHLNFNIETVSVSNNEKMNVSCSFVLIKNGQRGK